MSIQTVITMRFYLATLGCFIVSFVHAQFLAPGVFIPAPEGYWVSVEEMMVHESGDLSGMTTYHVYLNCLNPGDYLSSCSGDSSNPLVVESSSGSWYNSEFNAGWNALGVNPALFGAYPDLAFDSFLTIGASSSDVPGGQHPQAVWGAIDGSAEFLPGTGQNVLVNDPTGGAWFTPFPGAQDAGTHAAFAGEDLQILMMQITTSGVVSGQVQLQVFMNADQEQEWRDLMPFVVVTEGCMDPVACNYDEQATEDDGSCTFPGCMDEQACNFIPESGCDDGSCSYPSPNEDCDGNCLVQVDCLGVCGGDAVVDGCGDCNGNGILGCIDADACNYNPSATCDDGTCAFPEPNFDCDGNCLLSVDCAGICGGQTMVDECGICGGSGAPCEEDCCQVELVWNEEYEDGSVECPEDLPASCEAFLNGQEVYAFNPCNGQVVEATCTEFLASFEQDYTAGVATTAKFNSDLGPGEYGATDGAVHVYGLEALGYADSDYFVEDPNEPLDWVHFPASGTAILKGRVHCRENENQWFDLDAVFEQEVNGAEWLAQSPSHSLLVADDPDVAGYQSCSFDSASVSVFVMNSTSYLQGGGDLEGSFLAIEHMPATLNKRFQLGQGMNNHNCNLGFGGWFRWSGNLMDEGGAVESVEGLSGDVVVDLSISSFEVECGEFVEFQIRALDEACGRILEQSVRIDREDTTPPVFLDAPEDVVVNCANVPDVPSLEALSVSDNCEGPINVEFEEILLDESPLAQFWPTGLTNTSLDGCETTYTLLRRWTAQTACYGVVTPQLAPFQQTVHQQFITVLDGEAPIISEDAMNLALSCGGDSMEMTIEEWLSSNGGAMATDNCDDSELLEWEHDFAGLVPGCGSTSSALVTFVVTDCVGNQAETSATISIVDETAPVMNCEDVEVSCGTYSADSLYAEMPQDNCGMVTLEWSDVPQSGGCGLEFGAYVRTYVATDECGNATTCEQVISLVNDVPPSLIETASDLVLTCSEDAELVVQSWLDNQGGALAEDDCGTVQWSYDSPVDWGISCAEESGTEVVFVASDGCGNSVSTSASILLTDAEPPVLSMPAEDLEISCAATNPGSLIQSWLANHGGATAGDECSEVSWSNNSGFGTETWEELLPSCSEGEGLEITFLAQDACGNSTSTSAHIEVVDDLAPVFTFVPADVQIECGQPIPMTMPIAEDGCGNALITESVDTLDGNCPQSFSLIRSFVATDDCGHQAFAQQTIDVVDNTPPAFDAFESTVVAECGEVAGNDLTYLPLTAQDACSEVAYTVESTCNSGGCQWSYLRVWTATDACGNAASVEQFVVLVDTIAPVVVAPDEVVLTSEDEACAGDLANLESGYPEFSDNCGAVDCWGVESVTVWFEDGPWMVACVGDDDLPEGSKSLMRTWYVADACGNIGHDDQVITFLDVTAPMGSLTHAEVACSEYDPAAAYGDISGSDNCDSEVAYTWIDLGVVSGEADGCQQIEREYAFVDDCGNADTLSQFITLVDDVAPIALGEVEVVLDCGEYNLGLAYLEALDNCASSEDVAIDFEDYPVSGGCVLPFGRYMRLYTLTDPCGNSTMFEQYITLIDTTNPVLVVPEDMVLSCSDELTLEDATASDDCGGEVVVTETIDYELGDCPGSYNIVRTFTAMDHCDNDTTMVQIISVVDTVAPVLSIPNDQWVQCAGEIDFAGAEATDDCGLDTILVQEETVSGDCPGHFTLMRTFTAWDECGNQSSATQTIVVADTTAPSFSFVPNDLMVDCSDDILSSLPMPEAQDNCGVESIVVEEIVEPGDCPNSYVITRVFTALDACGNAVEASHVVVVTDGSAPVISGGGDLVVECNSAEVEGALSDWLDSHGGATAMDNCTASDLLVWSYPDSLNWAEGCDANGSLTVEFSVMDVCGNESTYEATFSVSDNTPPHFAYTGGFDNHEVQEVCCESLAGGVFIPEAVQVTWDDDCSPGGVAPVQEECVGDNCPTEDVAGWCDITTPEPLPDGQTCDNYDAHSLRLFNFPGSEYYTTVEGRVANLVDGTMTYTVTVVATDNPDAGWTITNRYAPPMTWQEWVDQPGLQSYKSDCGLGNHEDWMYTTLTQGMAQGWGDYEGDSLSFTHQPMSAYFGFQIGEGANNKNDHYGFSGWMYYSGMVDGESIVGSGDIFGDLDCCLPYDIHRSYVIEDCSGNTSQFMYTVRLTGGACDEGNEGTIAEGSDEGPVVAKEYIKIESLQPNPTSGDANLVLSTLEEEVDVQVRVLAMGGEQLFLLFDGTLVSGWNTSVDIPSSELESGLYLIQIRAKEFVTSKKLIVAN